jgi:N-acetylmuramoyl-L-alanine amidase
MRWNFCSFGAAAPARQRPIMVPSMKLNRSLNRYLTRLLVSCAVASTAVLMALPAQAAKLQTWGFDAGRSQLEFTTDEGVQPSAQLIVNPTRLVIDLPGVVFGRPQTSQPVNSAAIRAVRVGQFEKTTTRIVIELEPGYTIDPLQVKFKGLSPRQWTVTIPTPQREIGGTTPPPTNPNPGLPNPGGPIPDIANTQIQSVRVTGDGFFVRTSGQIPQIRLSRSPDKRRMDVDLLGASISPSVSPRDFIVSKPGVSRVIVTQLQATPPIARISLTVDPTTPDWQATYSDIGGVVLLPNNSGSVPVGTTPPAAGGVATIQAVDLDNNNQQLSIAASQPISYTAGWDRSAGYYKVTIPNAQLDKNLKGPKLGANSPLLQVRLRQETPKTVAILISPAAGVVVNSPISTGRQSIGLPLTMNRSLPPVVFPTDGTVIPVPPTQPGGLPGPRTPIGRAVVVIDPGHGGADPGAVGRGNIYEKEIVMDISRQVANILAQNGVQAILTRNSDVEIDLEPRVAMAERANASVFVSIHANAISLDRPDVNGLETYYFESGLGLANSIHANILRSANIEDRRVRKARFYVIRKTSMPSVLVETGFVTGATDAANLSTPAHRQNMARGIAQGILQYLRGG